MEIEAHFSADPYQLPVATVHYLSQGPVVHASPQVIEKLALLLLKFVGHLNMVHRLQFP
jgi:hypothetical protein